MRYDVPSDGFEGATSDEGHRRPGVGYEYGREVLKRNVRDNHNPHCTWFVMRTAIYQRQERQHNALSFVDIIYVVFFREFAQL